MNCSTPHEFSTLQLFLFSGVRVTQSVFYAMFFGKFFVVFLLVIILSVIFFIYVVTHFWLVKEAHIQYVFKLEAKNSIL